MTDEQWQEAREEARRDMPVRAKLYRCSDRTCGSLDCASCYGAQAAAQYVAEQEEEDEPNKHLA